MPNRGSGNKTKLAIANALRSIMKKKPLDKIKIKEIVDECGLNRQTFYYHFQDIYDLIEWMYWYDGNQIFDKYYIDEGILKTAKVMLHYVQENREELLNVINSRAEIFFFNFVNSGLFNCIYMIINEKAEDKRISEKYKTFLAQYYSSAVYGVVKAWITDSSTELSIDDNLEMFTMAMDGSISLALKQFSKKK